MNLARQALSFELDPRGLYLRNLVLQAVSFSGRGHIGPSFSLLEIVDTLYSSVLNHDPSNPSWPKRDFFILSKGHGCLGLYAVLANQGYFPISELSTFCSFDSRLGGHPEWHSLPGVEFSTGSLGHGLSIASGIAMALKMEGRSNRVFTLIGDGELGEGSIWESLMHISKHNLVNLISFIDYNNMQAYGELSEVLPVRSLVEKFNSFGFKVIEINGHSRTEIKNACSTKIFKSPLIVLAHTIKGKGIPEAENSREWHHKAKIKPEDLKRLMDFNK